MCGEYTDYTRSYHHPGAQFWVGSRRNWSVFLERPSTGRHEKAPAHCPCSRLAALHGAPRTQELLHALNEMKTGKAPGHSEASLELIASSWGVGIHVMAEMRQKVQGGFGMPAEMTLRIVVPILKGKSDIWNCCCY